MNFQITDAKTRFFKDKEHYLAFRQAWKDAINDGYEPSAMDMLLYAVLRGKDARSAFTPTTKKSKIDGGQYINRGLYFAYVSLNHSTISGPLSKFVDEDTRKIIVSEVSIQPLYGDYGVGRKIAETLGALTDKRGLDLWGIIDQIEEKHEVEKAEKMTDKLVKDAVGTIQTKPIERKKILGLF